MLILCFNVNLFFCFVCVGSLVSLSLSLNGGSWQAHEPPDRLWGANPLALSCDAAQAYQGARGGRHLIIVKRPRMQDLKLHLIIVKRPRMQDLILHLFMTKRLRKTARVPSKNDQKAENATAQQ